MRSWRHLFGLFALAGVVVVGCLPESSVDSEVEDDETMEDEADIAVAPVYPIEPQDPDDCSLCKTGVSCGDGMVWWCPASHCREDCTCRPNGSAPPNCTSEDIKKPASTRTRPWL